MQSALRSLKGKTIFITGASRGIGKAIAIRAARDGANIIVAAKTADPHPKLEGTIFTAAEEIRAAGGNALPLVVDIRSVDQIEQAVESAVKEFGGESLVPASHELLGIDILINNASAISLTNTLQTDHKKYDLMNGINARGTYLTSRACLPHLLKSQNPHILNISPPLDLNPKWFKNHTAYTMAKYGMSLCVLGMSAEFEGKVAVNALWPRTVIGTAAVTMLGGDKLLERSRDTSIMSDSAWFILTRDHTCSGNFFIDEEVLFSEGITDLSSYAINEAVAETGLLLDFFLEPPQDQTQQKYLPWGTKL